MSQSINIKCSTTTENNSLELLAENFKKLATLSAETITTSNPTTLPYTDIANTTVHFSEKTYEDIFQEIMKRFNIKPTFEHKCHNCGGTLIMNEEQHIFNCPYCNSVYAIGTSQINSQLG